MERKIRSFCYFDDHFFPGGNGRQITAGHGGFGCSLSGIASTIGTTAGMLVADGLAVFLGEHLTRRISMRWIHSGAAALFATFGNGLFIQG